MREDNRVVFTVKRIPRINIHLIDGTNQMIAYIDALFVTVTRTRSLFIEKWGSMNVALDMTLLGILIVGCSAHRTHAVTLTHVFRTLHNIGIRAAKT